MKGILHLAVRLENGQRVYFTELTALQQAITAPKTTLTEFFSLCNRQDVVGQFANRINLPLFSTVVPAVIFVFLSCKPFVAITTLSTGFVGVEVTSVS